MTEPITRDIRDLVLKVLESGLPRSEHVIDQVFHAIEHSPQWRAEYEGLRERFKGKTGEDGKHLVNQMIGRWTSSALGWSARVERAQVNSHLNTLSATYSVLIPSDQKLTTEQRGIAAGKQVLGFFRAHRAALNRDALLPLRNELEARVVQGEPVEEAFLSVMTVHGVDIGPLQGSIASGAS